MLPVGARKDARLPAGARKDAPPSGRPVFWTPLPSVTIGGGIRRETRPSSASRNTPLLIVFAIHADDAMKKTILLLPFIWTLLPLSGQEMDPEGIHPVQLRQVRVPDPHAGRRPALHRRVHAQRPVPDLSDFALPDTLQFPALWPGPLPFRTRTHPQFARDGYIFVYQDVRGRYMSEGEFVQLTPHLPKRRAPLRTSTRAPTPTTPSNGSSLTSRDTTDGWASGASPTPASIRRPG